MEEYNNTNTGNVQGSGDYVDIYQQPTAPTNQAQTGYNQQAGYDNTGMNQGYSNPSMNPGYSNPSMNAGYSNPSMNPGYRSNPTVTAVPSENVVMGIIGALLFGFAGGLLHFVIYQIGFIAYICGLAIFVLPFIGYTKFGKAASVKGLIISIVISIVTVFLSEYTSLAFVIYNEFKKIIDITFMDAFVSVPRFLAEFSELKFGFIKDLVILYIFGVIGIIGWIKKK